MEEQRSTFEENQRFALEAVGKLSPRELQVLKRMIEGASNKEIGRYLGISHRTVEIHRAKLITKLRGCCSADAIRIGVYAGLDAQ
jgi:two-component system, LuxR family, response regulator FixJ